VQIPVFADADTGYGDAISTHYTVREYIQAGIAGAHIEDQTFPPKSGPRRRCISIQEPAPPVSATTGHLGAGICEIDPREAVDRRHQDAAHARSARNRGRSPKTRISITQTKSLAG
jgi:hypothetical protein